MPDFSDLVLQWESNTRAYGEVTFYVFPSRDRQLFYTFCKDEQGRSWIGNIEVDEHVLPTGLHRNWVDVGDLVTPALEYEEQADGFGVEVRIASNNVRGYVDMYPKYLSKIPVIREFEEELI